jgi:hypothetical protein
MMGDGMKLSARVAQLRLPRIILPALATLTVAVLLTTAHQALVDMAPFPAEAGTSFGAATTTDIRMISETVLIQVVAVTRTLDSGTVFTTTGAKVTADFLLNNPQSSPQSLQVGFPLDVPSQYQSYGGFAKLTGLRAFVAGDEATTAIETIGQETWSAWTMAFAPGNNTVRVTYDLPATVDNCRAELGYVLHTGAAWAGSIGQADLIVRYPYVAETTFVSPHGLYLGDTTAGYQVVGTDLHWHYDNLEPTRANDLAVTFVTPDCWLKVAEARNALNAQATAENYWGLASAYANLVLGGHNVESPLIAQVADAQYLKALALDPQNPQINSGYAEFLASLAGYLLPASRQPNTIAQCVKALQLAPGDDELGSTCGYFLSKEGVDWEATTNAESTVTAVTTTVPQASPAPSRAALTQATATPLPATHTPTAPAATATTAPRATATAPATQIAELPVSPPPTVATAARARTDSASWVPYAIAAIAVLLITGLWLARRRRSA